MLSIDIKRKQDTGERVVAITNTLTGDVKIHPYQMKTHKHYVIEQYTSFSAVELKMLRNGDDIVRLYKKIGDELGCSIKQFTKMLNGATYRAYVKEHEALHNRVGITHRRVGFKTTENGTTVFKFKTEATRDTAAVAYVNKHHKMAYKFINDGMNNLVAFAILLGKEAYELKHIIGKKPWKKLCANAKTRNDSIVRAIGFYGNDIEHTAKLIRILNTVPTTLLINKMCQATVGLANAAATLNMPTLPQKAIEHFNIPLYKIEPGMVQGLINTVFDTHRMLREEGNAINPKWSIKRIEREHKECSKRLLHKRHSDERFTWIDNMPLELEDNGFKATLCTSELEIALLGNEEHHCVGSYAARSTTGNYAVYKIVDENGYTSTLGIKHPKSIDYSMNQHYHACNSVVTDEERIKFANKVQYLAEEAMVEYVTPEETKNRLFGGPRPAGHGLAVPQLAPAAMEIAEHINNRQPGAGIPLFDNNIPF